MEASIKIGLALKNFVGPGETLDIDGLYAYAERAEALGFESLWAWDHVILGVEPAFPILDAVGTLTAIAARTSRIKLGTGVLVLPLRNPTVAAKALGTLDVVSKGRLILGVAAGWYAREFGAVGSSSGTSRSSRASGRKIASASRSTSSTCARP